MSFRLVAVDKAIHLGEISDREREFLVAQLTEAERGAAYYIDDGAISAVEDAARSRYANWFGREVQKRCEQTSNDDLRKKVGAVFTALPDDMRAAKLQAVLRPAVLASLKRMKDDVRELLVDALFTGDDTALDDLAFDVRQDALIMVLAVAPDPYTGEQLVTFDYNQLAFAWSSIHIQGTEQMPVDLEADQEEAAAREMALKLTDAMVRALILSADDEQFKASLLFALEAGWRKHMHRLFEDELDADLEDGTADPAFLESMRALVQLYGSIEVADVEGKPTHALTVEVVEGRELAVRDLVSSDPYCKLSVHDTRLRSQQIHTTDYKANTLNPRWDETFHFAISEKGEVRVEVFDRDTIGADDPMGTAVLSIADLDLDASEEGWHKLQYVKTGEVKLITKLRKLTKWNEE